MSAESVDPQAILAALGLGEGWTVTRVRGGWDTAIWNVERGTAAYALRVFRADQADQRRREVRAMQAAAQGGVPVPRVHGQTTWQGRPALLLSWCAGRPLLREIQAHPWRVWSLGVAMGRVHRRMHTAPVPDALADSLPAWLPRAGDSERALQSRVRAMLADAADRPGLLHLDYHPLNVMSTSHAISGVLDWANAAVGDPRADVARTVTLLRLAPAPPDAPAALLLALRRLLEAAWLGGYRQLAGQTHDMAPFYAWAGAMMERDLRSKLGQPGVWLRPSDLARIGRWTATWKRRAGIEP
ncbi:MAG: aminoglycoside phosphotransferase family protein [Chloroflexota bacterium]|nr:aminoglycoside phosphotransferase family protein [Chloroflexota bacterium]